MIFRCISILLLCVSSVISWGPQGHEIIATYAQLTGDVNTINKLKPNKTQQNTQKGYAFF